MMQKILTPGTCALRNNKLSKNDFHVIDSFMLAGFSKPNSDSLIKTVLGYLAASIHSPCIYNCLNRLTLCLIS